MDTLVRNQTAAQAAPHHASRIRLRGLTLPVWANWIFAPLAALLINFCAAWIHLGSDLFRYQFFWVESFWWHRAAWFAGWVFILLVYLAFLLLSHRPTVAVTGTSLLICIPALITYYKLALRGEPFLPWDFAQASEAAAVAGKVGLWVSPSMAGAGVLLLLLLLISRLIPRLQYPWRRRLVHVILSGCAIYAMIFGVFLQERVTRDILYISPDAWMQDRYYRNYGLVTAFFTNIQVMNIDAPDGYSADTVQALLDETTSHRPSAPLYSASYAAVGDGAVKTPHIIYIMDEAFWDPSELPGVTFSAPITPNLTRLRQQAAFGKSYSPRFGGGTCDVECEALTGFSMDYLPSSCKPYVEYIRQQTDSIASFRRAQGYQTLAMHGYYAKFWNRENAYRDMGFDDFISLEDMQSPERKRPCDWEGGLVTDAEMGRQIISAFEARTPGQPLFLHAVTIQNHLAYMRENYPDDERIHVLDTPADMNDYTRGCLEDFATGARDADAMIGMLTDYFDQVDEPVILVLWGDHYNAIGDGMSVYTTTGYASDSQSDPRVHGTPLFIWSNYHKQPVDLGTVAAYQITTVTDDLYGLAQPAYFDLLRRQLDVYRARSLGVTITPDSQAVTGALTPAEQAMYDKQWLLQYDLLFGKRYQNRAPQ